MYVYPSVMNDDIIDAISQSERVCKYVDIPLQHINDRKLRAMHRRITRAETERLLQKLRDRIPGVSIRTTLIAGFPGETEAEFNELLQFVEDFRFDALGVFPYSQEPDTPAGRMRDQIADEGKNGRVDALMRVQQKVAFDIADSWKGRQFRVLVDERLTGKRAIARHEGQAPGVDSSTIVERCDASPGEFVTVTCSGRRNYDLTAAPTRVRLPVVHL